MQKNEENLISDILDDLGEFIISSLGDEDAEGFGKFYFGFDHGAELSGEVEDHAASAGAEHLSEVPFSCLGGFTDGANSGGVQSSVAELSSGGGGGLGGNAAASLLSF